MRIDPDILRQCWFLAGPTACGKTAVSLALAENIDAEIIALDSMSLYRGMDTGTAKASLEEQARVPHHLIDVINPEEEYSIADYISAADRACRDILSRGMVPLFVGGTGLYLRGLLRGVFEGPAADWDFRHQMEAEAEQSPSWLHDRLKEVDNVSAGRLHPNDHRRIIRALEIHHLTGRPASEQQKERPLPVEQRPLHVHWLSPPREWLYDRIDRRVRMMMDNGFIDEVASLLARSQPLSRTARQALGYRELITHLAGECTLEEAIVQIQTNTRQFAKRQHTWFRNLDECHEVSITATETAAELIERMIRGSSSHR